MRRKIDLSLYLVTDRPLSLGRPIDWIVEEAVKGGTTIVQLREKDCSTREFIDLAVKLKKTLAPYNVALLINDRVDVALAADADGVHLGQSDMDCKTARQLLGPDKIIGLSIEHIDETEAANQLDIDYVAVSPVYLTGTKTDTSAALGIDGVKSIVAKSVHPVVGIGGMNKNTIADVIAAGADGVAVVSAIVSANSPKESSAELISIVKQSKL